MIRKIKARLYFIVAWYFRFFAAIKLRRWSPKVIVVTGSAGKTTLLHLLEAQLGDRVHYSHHANSAFGICFDILGLHGVTESRKEWLKLFLAAPVVAFQKPYSQAIYVAEADVDRPGEGKFLANLLQPDITLWVSSLHTHVQQFGEAMHRSGATGEELVAAEYGNFAQATKELLVIDGDNPLMVAESKRSGADVHMIKKQDMDAYKLGKQSTTFEFREEIYTFSVLMPEATYYQVAMVDSLLAYMDINPDFAYKNFKLPPGRSSVFHGIKNTTIIDSTYNNSNIATLTTMVELFDSYPVKQKWLVIGDMLEQGVDEDEEHKKIAEVLNRVHVERVICVGPRIIKNTVPRLSASLRKRSTIVWFEEPKDALDYLLKELRGHETLFFKGVRYMEGIVEKLLADPMDEAKLARRGLIWDKKRSQWGL